MPESRVVRVIEGGALSLLLLAVCLAPLPVGSESAWAQSLLSITVAAAAILWVVAGCLRGSVLIPRSWCLLFILLFILIGFLQLAPLSTGTVGTLSPGANVVRDTALGPQGLTGDTTLSLNPYATRTALFRYGTCALLFLVMTGLLRGKRAIIWAVSLLLAAGLFQVAYAMIDHVAGSGGESVFWADKKHYASSFSGTFFNKNHFAGFLEMLVPLGVGLVLAIRRRRYAQPFELLSDRIADTLSDPGTHKRIVLAAIPVLLGIGVVMSMSRSGVICTAAALGVMVAFGVAVRGRGRRIGALIALLLAMAAVTALFVSSSFISGFEQELEGGMPSTGKRIDMLRSASVLVGEFPLLGTGLGTTEDVFGRYQSLNLGNVHVDWLANDWAQIACEAGLVGLVVVGLGLCWFVVSTVRAAMRRNGSYCRWVALGCITGVVAMMLHSLSDFNLTRTMSNGMLFAALLAVAHAAARAGGPGQPDDVSTAHWQLRLGPAPLRILFALLAATPVVWLAVAAGEAGAGDVRFNYYRHYAGKPRGLYFLLPLPERLPPDAMAVAEFDLEEAVRHCPGNPAYAHALGEARADEVRRRVAEVVDAIIRIEYPLVAEVKDTEAEAYNVFRLIPERRACEELAAEIAEEGLLDKAIADFRKAIRIAPSVGKYHLSLARALSLKARMPVEGWDAEALLSEAEVELERTVYFTRNVPYMLFDVARVLVRNAAIADDAGREAGIARATVLLRRALLAAPGELGRKAFVLLKAARVDNSAILEATPKTVRASRYLSQFFFAQKDWADLVAALDRMEAAAVAEQKAEAAAETQAPVAKPSKSTDGAPESLPPLFNWMAEDHTSVEFKLGIARRRIAVLGYMGKWPERRAAQEKQAVLLRKRVGEIVAESRALRLAGDYDRALRSCKLALTLAPHDVDALIEMARATSVPHYRGLMSAGYAPLACLFRAVNNNDSLTAQQAGEIVTLLADQKGLVGRDELAVRLIRSAATILQTGSGAASGSRTAELHKLRKLAAHIEEESILWRQRHLVWHYLGLALEKRGETVEAEQMYAKAAALVRNHLRSLAALVRLARQRGDSQAADRYAARVAALTPAQPCAVTFAGKIRLLGYSVIPGESASGVAPMIRYYWELLEPIPEGCVLQTYLLDYEWRIVRPDQRRLVRASGVYPAEFARRGEVVVETRPLPPKFPNVRYLGFGARPAKVTAGSAEKWTGDAGSTLARLALISGDAK